MKILVAGSNSFVGKNIAQYYSCSQDIELILLSRSNCDLSNADELTSICRSHLPDLVIHSAVSLEDTNNNIAMFLSLEQSSSYFGKAVMIGSGAEYSHQRYQPDMLETYFDVRHPPSNNHPYHLSKHVISRLHANSYADNIYNFRVFGLYGLFEDHTRRLISNNIYNYMKTGRMSVSANHAFDYLYVDDLISAIEHFARSKTIPKHRTYNVCNGRADRFYSILSEVITVLGGSVGDIDIQSKEPTDYVYSGDSSLFQDEFNYTIYQTTYSRATHVLSEWLTPMISLSN